MLTGKRGFTSTSPRDDPLSGDKRSPREIPESEREAERKVFAEKAKEEGKPDDVVEKIVEGQLSKWASEVALLDQAHVNAEKHDSKSIEELRQELAAKTGENIRVARFAYFRVGA